MGILTFDWAQIASLGNPTTLPWWAIANLGMALPIVFWFICPLIYYLNVSTRILKQNEILSYTQLTFDRCLRRHTFRYPPVAHLIDLETITKTTRC